MCKRSLDTSQTSDLYNVEKGTFNPFAIFSRVSMRGLICSFAIRCIVVLGTPVIIATCRIVSLFLHMYSPSNIFMAIFFAICQKNILKSFFTKEKTAPAPTETVFKILCWISPETISHQQGYYIIF